MPPAGVVIIAPVDRQRKYPNTDDVEARVFEVRSRCRMRAVCRCHDVRDGVVKVDGACPAGMNYRRPRREGGRHSPPAPPSVAWSTPICSAGLALPGVTGFNRRSWGQRHHTDLSPFASRTHSTSSDGVIPTFVAFCCTASLSS